MGDEPIVGEQPEGERPKPRVVDRRAGARPEGSAPDTEPSSPPADPRVTSDSTGPAPSMPEGDASELRPHDPRPQDHGHTQDSHGHDHAGHDHAHDHAGLDHGGHVWTPEAEAEARAAAEEILSHPGVEWVVNFTVNLANIAATKLEFGPPADAAIVIDALAGILKEVGDRLGNVEQPLRQTLAQLQMAYTDRVTTGPAPGTPSTPHQL